MNKFVSAITSTSLLMSMVVAPGLSIAQPVPAAKPVAPAAKPVAPAVTKN
jgi:hypothetical protein